MCDPKYQYFRIGPDFILSDESPISIKSLDLHLLLGAWLRIGFNLKIITIGAGITRDPLHCYQEGAAFGALPTQGGTLRSNKLFPQFEDLADF